MKKGNIKRDCPEKKGIDEKKVSSSKSANIVKQDSESGDEYMLTFSSSSIISQILEFWFQHAFIKRHLIKIGLTPAN